MSTRYPPKSNENISAKVVVCFPVLYFSETSAVFKFKFGISKFIKEDFPTPELPANADVLSFNIFRTDSILIFSSTDIPKHSYPIFS